MVKTCNRLLPKIFTDQFYYAQYIFYHTNKNIFLFHFLCFANFVYEIIDF